MDKASVFPAYAGVILLEYLSMYRDYVFPAYAGVILKLSQHLSTLVSLSRVCGGDPDRFDKWVANWGVFPAYAGVILDDGSNRKLKLSLSRVCGGDPNAHCLQPL